MDLNKKILAQMAAIDADQDLDSLVNGVLYSTSMQDCFMDSTVNIPMDAASTGDNTFLSDSMLFQDQIIDHQQQQLSSESLTDEGSPYSIGFASPHSSSTDSGILISSPESPVSPNSNTSIPNYATFSSQEFSQMGLTQQNVPQFLYSQQPVQSNQLETETDSKDMIQNLKQLIDFFSNNDQLKDHLQKQQQQQRLLEAQVMQQSRDQQLLLAKLSAIQNAQVSNSTNFNVLPDMNNLVNPVSQTVGTPINIIQPASINNPMNMATNVNTVPVVNSTNNVTPTIVVPTHSIPSNNELNPTKESQFKNFLDKRKNQLLSNIKETKDKMKLKGNKLGKRKLPNNTASPNLTNPDVGEIKQTKVEVQNPVLDLEVASAVVNNLQCKNMASLQNSTLASLLMQPKKIERNEMMACSKPTPIAPAPENMSKNEMYLPADSPDSYTEKQQQASGKGNNKRTRVEHVVIEKRYRMKITESLKELKKILGCEDEKKSTKNGILQAAIIEIKRLRKENISLKKKNVRMRQLFEELKNIGIIPESQMASSASGSEASDHRIEPADEIEEESSEPVNGVDHHAFPLARPSARDGVKTITCFAMFLFLFITPFSLMTSARTVNTGTHYSSRHLLSVLEQDPRPPSPLFFLFSKIVQIFLSLTILMFMILHGNPKCSQNPEIVLSFKGHLRKAQKKINKKNYDDAKGMLRIALFVIGNSCPKTLYGQWASFLWKCICHILFQLGILTTLESIGRIILPSVLSGEKSKSDQNFTASLSMKAYIKLHEVAIKDPSSTYLETACYLMNAVHSAEVSGDQELIATAYSTAVVHMKEKVKFCSILLQYYFTSCAHHASLLSQDSQPYAVDWIFERYGYDYFVHGLWNIHRQPVFHVQDMNTDLDEADLLQTVYAQFQDYTLTKALKRLVLPETFYPNEGKIELRHRALSILETLGTGPPSEQTDSASLYHHSIYGWWKCALKNMLHVVRNEKIEWNDIEMEDDFYRDITEDHRSHLIVLAKSVITAVMSVHQLKNKSKDMTTEQITTECNDVRKRILEASQNMNEAIRMIDGQKEMYELQELIQIMCCDLLLDAGYILWTLKSDVTVMTEQELNFYSQQNEMLQCYSFKYSELFTKVQTYDHHIQEMSGSNEVELRNVLKRSKHIKQAGNQPSVLSNTYYLATQNYPLKQDGFVRP